MCHKTAYVPTLTQRQLKVDRPFDAVGGHCARLAKRRIAPMLEGNHRRLPSGVFEAIAPLPHNLQHHPAAWARARRSGCRGCRATVLCRLHASARPARTQEGLGPAPARSVAPGLDCGDRRRLVAADGASPGAGRCAALSRPGAGGATAPPSPGARPLHGGAPGGAPLAGAGGPAARPRLPTNGDHSGWP